MKLAKYLKPYILLAVISPLMMIGEVTGDLMQPKLMSKIVDNGIINGDMGYTMKMGALMLGIVAIGGFFGVFCAYTAARAAQSFGKDLRVDAYRHVMSLSISQTDKFTTGSLVTRMTNDIAMIVDFVEMLLRGFIRAPMFMIGGTVMILTLNLSFGVVLLCALPVLAITIFGVMRKATPLYFKVQKKLDNVNSVVQENVAGARVVKAYTREEYEQSRFNTANAELCDTNFGVLKLMAIISPVMTLVLNISIVAIIYIGGFQISIKNAGMTTGEIMAAITYSTQILWSIMMVTNMFQSVSRAVASGRRVIEVLETEPDIVSGSECSQNNEVAVSFKNVSFSYPETNSKPVLQNISFDIKKGECFAIIGSTGAGKTSLVNLISRFYDPTVGTVEVDGTDLRKWELSALRERIGFVMQKSELFSDTVSKNIKWGKSDATQNEVINAAKIAQADEFINGFAEKYDAFIAEKGASLSGGQKQRMSIARAVIRKPVILILDDSTSALDLSTEAKLHKALRENLSKSTVIMIAQRIASVKNADRIAVIEDGKIIDLAPHSVLINRCETYKDIYSSQMKSGALVCGGEQNE